MRKSYFVKILLSAIIAMFFFASIFDLFNLVYRLNIVPIKPCSPIPVQFSINDSIKLIKNQKCDFSFEIKTGNNSLSLFDDRLKQLQLSFLIYHNQRVFDKSPYSTIRTYRIVDDSKAPGLEGENIDRDLSISVKMYSGFEATIHEANHTLVRQRLLESPYRPWLATSLEKDFFKKMLGSDYRDLIEGKMSLIDVVDSFGSPIPFEYLKSKNPIAAGTEANAYLVQQYFYPESTRSARINANLKRMQDFTDVAIGKGYHSGIEIQSILQSPFASEFYFGNDRDLQVERLIERLNKLSSQVTKANYKHRFALLPLFNHFALMSCVLGLLLVFRVRYGVLNSPKNNKPFSIC
jgi:hypothetical protein